MPNVILKCPACEGDLAVARLHCHACDISIAGDFAVPALLRLSRAQLDFVEVFLKNRGNIREVERELGVSYPTVRARLDEVLDAIGLNLAAEPETARQQDSSPRRAVLEQVRDGKLTPEEAMRALGASSRPAVSKAKIDREEPDHG